MINEICTILNYILYLWMQWNISKHPLHKLYHPPKEGVILKVIVHPPRTLEGLHDLQKKVATVHAEAVLKYIAKLSCPKEQRIELVCCIQNSFKE